VVSQRIGVAGRMAVLVGLLVTGVLAAACGTRAGISGPTPCAQVFSAKRCLVMTDAAAVEVSKTRADVVAIDVIPEPTMEAPNGNVLMVRSGGPDVHVRITLRDGTAHIVSMGCLGISNQVTCSDDPHLSVDGLQIEGYRDLPCSGEPPDGCATQLPPVEAEALADATTLRISRLDIPIDHVGDYRVIVGEARLPNGIVTEESFGFVDDWPANLTILSGRVGLGVRSLEPDGRMFANYYAHGWRQGTERVEAYLAFHIDGFDPGAMLSVRDIVVR
jgi:hypothetical protein